MPHTTATPAFDTDGLNRIDKHFAAYVDDGRLPGWELQITHGADVVHTSCYGLRDKESNLPVAGDTLWRIASMTKPIASVAAMTLWQEGVFSLNDPISRWLPEFEDMDVYVSGSAADPVTVPAREPIRVWHILSHSSGLSVGFMYAHVVDEIYRNAEAEFLASDSRTLADAIRTWSKLPLRFEPGTAWGYGVSTDVLGRLIEIWSGLPLDQAIHNRVLEPLGMTDTVWQADPVRAERLAALYEVDPANGQVRRNVEFGARATHPPMFLSAGGGLLGTLADYTRFTRMLACGGTFDGARILAPSTVRLMASNHMPQELATLATGGFAETSYAGVGFGLGFAVVTDPVQLRSSSAVGEFYWGGLMSTAFWVDPVNSITCTFMTSLMPSNYHPIRPELRQLVYSAFNG